MSFGQMYCFSVLVFIILLSTTTGDPRGQALVTENIDTTESQHNTLTSCSECDYIIEPNEYRVDNAELNLPPGSILGIKGKNRKGIYLINFHGTPEKPFLVINCDGQTTITKSSVGIKIHESSHIRVTGTGSTDKYGIKITAPLHGLQAEHGSTDFEIDHIEISGSKSTGFSARSNPETSTNRNNFIQRNTKIHHNYIHDVGNEGIYVGGSHWHTTLNGLKEPELTGVRIYNNHVENTGYDGIQVGSAIKDCEIYNNVVINYGQKNSTYHQSGLQINPGTTGKIYNNYIKGGTGNAIFLTGFGNDVYNNLIVDCNKNAFYIGDRNPLPNQHYRIVNNTIVNVNGYALVINSDLSNSNLFYNNALVNITKGINNMGTSRLVVKNNFEVLGKKGDLFTDPENLDFSPLQDSPLIDAGVDVNASTGMNIEGDYLFRDRRSGETIDIGAFEFQSVK